MKFLLPFILLSLASSALAEVTNQKVDRMLKKMVKEEVISALEAEKAKARLHTMKPTHWKDLNLDSKKVASRSPASDESRVPDLYKAQYSLIEDDISKFIPESRD